MGNNIMYFQIFLERLIRKMSLITDRGSDQSHQI